MPDLRDDPGDGETAPDRAEPRTVVHPGAVEVTEDGKVVEHLSVSLDVRSAVWVVAGLIAMFVLASFFAVTRRSVTVVGVGILLAFAIEPLVLAVERRFGARRGVAVGVVGAGLLVAFGILALLVGPPAVEQAQAFPDELPETLQQLEDLPIVGPRLEAADTAQRVQDWVESLPGRVDSDGIGNAARNVLNGALNGLGVLLVAVVALIDGPLLIRRVRVAIPSAHRDRADAVGRVFYTVIGTYFAGSLLVASIGGTYVLTVSLIMGVPLAPVAAVWYAVVSLIPQVGGFLGTSFVTILALTQGVPTALVVLVLVVLYMNAENYLISPAIVGEAVDLSPPVTMLAALIGGAAAGVPGALVATPACGTVKALYQQYRHGEMPPPPTRMRDRVKIPARLKALLDRRRRGSD